MDALKVLEKQLLSGKLFHAIIFSGPANSGKLEAAKQLAIKSGGVAFILDAGEKTAEEFREFAELSRLGTGQRQFFIIDHAHKLTLASFSSFLKTLEENRGKSSFILLDESQSLPETIISRCITIRFQKTSVTIVRQIIPDKKSDRLVWADKASSLNNLDEVLNDVYNQAKLNLENNMPHSVTRMRLVLEILSQAKHNANKKLLLHNLANNW